MIGDHVKLTQKCVSPRFFFSRFSEGLITFQNLLNRSTVASLETSQVAYEQALRVALAAGREKKGELARLWNLILHRKSRCEMLIGGDDISNDVITLGTCFSMLVLHSRSFPLRADWRKSDSSVDGEPQGNWRWNSNSRDVVASSPSFSRPAARAPRRVCPVLVSNSLQYVIFISLGSTSEQWKVKNRRMGLLL